MKRLLFLPLLLVFNPAVNAGISDELNKKCLEARDYAGCVRANNKLLHRLSISKI